MFDLPLNQLPEVFFKARRSSDRVILEGFHPLKHAWRFGAEIEMLVSKDPEGLARFLKEEMAYEPEIEAFFKERLTVVDSSFFEQLLPEASKVSVIAIAARPQVSVDDLLVKERKAPLVILEKPSHMGNIGATIRVSAAAGASGVVVAGQHDPWHPAAVRGAAGLQFALPVATVATLPAMKGPLIAVHPEGELLTDEGIPDDALLVFGSESKGLTQEMLTRVERKVSIPMEPGVSSLNLATSVAIVLYTWRLGTDRSKTATG